MISPPFLTQHLLRRYPQQQRHRYFLLILQQRSPSLQPQLFIRSSHLNKSPFPKKRKNNKRNWKRNQHVRTPTMILSHWTLHRLARKNQKSRISKKKRKNIKSYPQANFMKCLNPCLIVLMKSKSKTMSPVAIIQNLNIIAIMVTIKSNKK